MKYPETLPDERQRQASLDSLKILDTPAEERYDRITRLARQLFDVPVVLVSLVDGDRQWFKSAQGLDATETPRWMSFCGHAIRDEDAFVVPDTHSDERFADNPLVTEGPEIRFYAGQPVRAPDGRRVGTLCLIDRSPRMLDGQRRNALRDMAALVESELAVARLSETQLELLAQLETAERKAAVDALTRAWSRSTIFELLKRELARSKRARLPLAVAMLDIDDFKAINDTGGHPAGDSVLRGVADRMRSEVRPYDAVGRYGGEEFIVILQECAPETALRIAERIRSSIASTPVETSAGPFSVSASIGLAFFAGEPETDVESMVAAADKALYQAKRKGKNRVVKA